MVVALRRFVLVVAATAGALVVGVVVEGLEQTLLRPRVAGGRNQMQRRRLEPRVMGGSNLMAASRGGEEEEVEVGRKKKRPCVAVVGAGIGGLALAGRLAARGASVKVFEKNAVAGGRVHEYRWGGHRWETGASLLLLPDVYREAFAAMEPAVAPTTTSNTTSLDEDDFFVRRVDPSYAVWFSERPELGPVDLGGDRRKLWARLELEAPGAMDRFDEYMGCAREYLRAGWPLFIEESVAGVEHLPAFLRNALSMPGRWPLFSHDSALRRLFPDSPRLRALCSFDDLYVGLEPRTAPAVFGLLAAIELDNNGGDETHKRNPRPDAGVWYPMGGFEEGVVNRLQRACVDRGVDFLFDCAVSRVRTEGGRAVGVDTDRGFFHADRVVCNADLTAAEPALLEDRGERRSSYDDAKYSTSSVTFLWAFDRVLAPLRHHNVFLHEEAPGDVNGDDPFRRAWEFAFPAATVKVLTTTTTTTTTTAPVGDAGFHFYVCAAPRTDPSAAPAGGDSIMVLVPVPPLVEGAEYDVDRLVASCRCHVLARLSADAGCGDGDILEGHLVHERIIAPPEWRDRLGLRRGAVFGLAHGLDQLAFFRPARTSDKVRHLSFVGASTRPGNGVPLVLTSAKLLARDLARDLGLEGYSS